MKRNRSRKRSSRGVRLPPVFLLTVILLTVLALSYLMLHNGCEKTGARIARIEKEREELKKEILNEEYKWSMMTTAKQIDRLLEKHGLEMTWPEERQIVRLQLHAEAAVEKLYARSASGGLEGHD